MATITVNLDDNASQGIQNLNKGLAQTADVSDHVAEATANLSAEQQHQIVIIQKQEASYKALAASAIPAIAQTGTAVIGLGRDLLHVAHAGELFALQMGGEAVKSLLRMAEMTVKYTLIAGGAVKVIHAAKGGHDESAESADRHQRSLISLAAQTGVVGAAYLTLTGQWQSAGQAATVAGSLALKTVNGLGPAAAALAVTVGVQNALWARTGIEVDAATGKVTSNLDRVNAASDRLGSAVAGPFIAIAENAREAIASINPFPTIWKEIDRANTEGAKNMVNNLNAISTALKGVTVEQEEWLVRIEAQREKEKEGFEGIRAANNRLMNAEADRQHAKRIAALKTDEEIDTEIRRVNEEVSKAAQAGEAAKVVEEWKFQSIEKLNARRAALRSDEETKLKQMSAARTQWELAAAQEVTAGYERELEARNKAAKVAYDEQLKIIQQFASAERDARFDAADESLKTVMAKLKEEAALNIEMQKSTAAEAGATDADVREAGAATEAKLAADIHALRIKQINVETNRKVEAAKTAEEALKAAHEGERARMRAESEFHRETQVQKIRNEKDAIKEIDKAHKDAAAKIAADLKSAGASGADMLARTDPRQVRANIAAGRGRAAGREFDDEHAKEREGANAAVRRRLDAQRASAMKKAEAEGRRDFDRGKADPREMAAGQNQATQQTLGAMQKNGKLSADTVKALSEQARIAAEQQATIGELQQQLKQVENYQKGLLGKAQQQRRQAQNGSS